MTASAFLFPAGQKKMQPECSKAFLFPPEKKPKKNSPKNRAA